MVKNHSNSDRGNPLWPLRGLQSYFIRTVQGRTLGSTFFINIFVTIFCNNNKKYSFTERIAHTTDFVTPIVELWLKREIAHWVDPMTHRTMSERSTTECVCVWGGGGGGWVCVCVCVCVCVGCRQNRTTITKRTGRM